MIKYNGEYGYGRIGDFKLTPQTKLSLIVREISEVFMNKMKKYSKENNIKFLPYTYVTSDHGQLEMITDMNGKNYGYDHGSCSSWGFNK